MPLINTSLPNLIQGVSQQADVVRYEGQCAEQENALSSVIKGLQKRPPTEYISTLLTTVDDDNDALKDSYVEFIKRDDDESYCLIIDGSKVRIFRIELADGVDTPTEASITVNEESYSDGYPITSSDYLYSTTSHQNIKSLTIGDSTILVNTALAVAKGSETSDVYDDEAFVFIKQGDYEKEYTITFGYPTEASEAYSVTSGTDSHGDNASSKSIRDLFLAIDAHNDADELATALAGASAVGDSGLLIDLSNSGLVKNGESPSSVSVSDGLSNTGIGVVHKEVETISDLPKYCKNNFSVKVRGDTEVSEDDYYVKFQTSNNQLYGNGSWIETLAPEIETSIGDNSPIQLVNTNENEFELRGFPFNKRLVGDEDSNPFPSFTGKSISNLFLFKNRLGFLAQDTVVMSEAGLGAPVNATSYFVNSSGDGTHADGYYYPLYLNSSVIYGGFTTFEFDAFPNTKFYRPTSNAGYSASTAPTTGEIGFTSESSIVVNKEIQGFNYFRTTTTTLLDSAPVDVRVSTRKVTNLKSAQAFQENLVIFSEEEQFILKGGDLLTPATVSITQATNYDYEPTVNPIALGSFIYFPFQRGDFSGVREYSLNATSDVYDSDEITQHVPQYITKDLTSLTGSNKEGIIAAVSGNVEATAQGSIDTTYTTTSIAGTSHSFIGGGSLIYHTTAYDTLTPMPTDESSTSIIKFDGTTRTQNTQRFINFVSDYSDIVGFMTSTVGNDTIVSNDNYDQMTQVQADKYGWSGSTLPYGQHNMNNHAIRLLDVSIPAGNSTTPSGYSTLRSNMSSDGYTLEAFLSLKSPSVTTPPDRDIFILGYDSSSVIEVGVTDRSTVSSDSGSVYLKLGALTYRSLPDVISSEFSMLHIMLIGDGSSLKVYVNNNIVLSITTNISPPTLDSTSINSIGVSGGANDTTNDTRIHYFRIYNKKISSAQRTINFNGRFN